MLPGLDTSLQVLRSCCRLLTSKIGDLLKCEHWKVFPLPLQPLFSIELEREKCCYLSETIWELVPWSGRCWYEQRCGWMSLNANHYRWFPPCVGWLVSCENESPLVVVLMHEKLCRFHQLCDYPHNLIPQTESAGAEVCHREDAWCLLWSSAWPPQCCRSSEEGIHTKGRKWVRR